MMMKNIALEVLWVPHEGTGSPQTSLTQVTFRFLLYIRTGPIIRAV